MAQIETVTHAFRGTDGRIQVILFPNGEGPWVYFARKESGEWETSSLIGTALLGMPSMVATIDESAELFMQREAQGLA